MHKVRLVKYICFLGDPGIYVALVKEIELPFIPYPELVLSDYRGFKIKTVEYFNKTQLFACTCAQMNEWRKELLDQTVDKYVSEGWRISRDTRS